MDYELQLDEYGQTTYASNGVARTYYALSDAGVSTNETRTTDNGSDTITRTFDWADRLTGLAIPGQGYDPEWSKFTRFFAENFERLGLKRVFSTSYAAAIQDYGMQVEKLIMLNSAILADAVAT